MKLTLRQIALFGVLGALTFGLKVAMSLLPNIEPVSLMVMLFAVVFGWKGLYPVYLYVLMEVMLYGINFWNINYLYIWAVLWGATMLIPRKLPVKVRCVLYPALCSLHGFAFGILYAPAQALIYGYNFEQAVAWVAAGFPFDIIHGISNLAAGTLIFSLSELLIKLYNGKVK